jgi:hypothetical protein
MEFKSCQRQKLFLPSKTSGLALGPHCLQFNWYRFSFLRLRRPGRGMMLTPHLHLAPKLRMSGLTPPLTIRHHVVDRDSFTFACSCTIHDLKIKTIYVICHSDTNLFCWQSSAHICHITINTMIFLYPMQQCNRMVLKFTWILFRGDK